MSNVALLLLIISGSACRKEEPDGPGKPAAAVSARQEDTRSMSRDDRDRGRTDTKEQPSEFEALRARLERFAPADSQALWEAIAALAESPGKKHFLFQQCLAKMCEAGQTEQAIKAVLTTFGEGERRRVSLFTVFSRSSESIERLCKLQHQLESPKDQGTAARGIAAAIGSLGDLHGFDPACLSNLGDAGRETLVQGLAAYVTRPRTPPDTVAAILGAALQVAEKADAGGLFGGRLADGLLAEVCDSAPFEVWNVLRERQGSEVNDALASGVIEQMAARDPARAMTALMNSGFAFSAKPVFARWLAFDSKEATHWFEQHGQSLPQAARNQVVAAIGEQAARDGDFGQAWITIRQINDPAEHRKAEGRIWQQELNAVQAEARKDPLATISAITSGQSQHADYWLEAAMRQWIAADSEAAAAWYETTGRSLPAEKVQYLAAAYARESLSQGDMAKARQWAGMISHEKTRQRIEGEMSRATESAEPQPKE